MRKGDSGIAQFLNVDLDIYSRQDLQPMVDRLGRKVMVLYAGRERRRFSAHLEVARVTRTADSTIRAFCTMVGALPRAERELWDRATVRSFSVGVQAGTAAGCTDFAIGAETIQSVSELGAEIVFTVYSAERAPRRRQAKAGPRAHK